MQALTAAQMREADRLSTERAGIPSLQLMETAGENVYKELMASCSFAPEKSIAFLCGKGNNGGDGLVAARKYLASNPSSSSVLILLFAQSDRLSGDAAVMLQRLQEAGGTVQYMQSDSDWEDVKANVLSAPILVDALLGTGLRGPAEGLIRRVIEDVNQRPQNSFLLAVDIPSGLPSDGPLTEGVAIRADKTVTFTAPKIGHFVQPNSDLFGELRVRSIGTPRSLIPSSPDAKLFWLETGEFRNLPLTRNWNSHKGDFGHALLVAGSLGKTGAAGLAAMGALRSGAGLVTVATPDSVLPVVAGYAPEMMTEPLASTDAGSISMRSLEYGRFDSILKGKNVLAIGPGLSTDPETQQFVRSVVSSCPLPIILDADGLNAFVSHPDELAKRKSSFLAITPHPGEMARLLGCTSAEVQSRRLSVATEAAARWNVYVILKGAGTILATPDGRAFINTSGTPALATGGTGDVLTGLLAGLTAQFGTSQWEKVLGLGIYLHGKAAEQLVAGHAHPHLLASDVAHAIPAAFDSLCREMSSDE